MNTLSELLNFTGENMGVIEVSASSVSSLPTTIVSDRILAKHACVKAVLSNPDAQRSDWTVTASSGSVTISGSISGSTNITLYLALKTNETGSATTSTISNKGFCYANTITTTTITATNTATKLPITEIARSNGFSYDSASKGIKCTKEGLYLFTLWVDQMEMSAGDLMGVSIYVNGSNAMGPIYTRVGGAYDGVPLLPTFRHCVVGDVITVYVRNNTGARGSISGIRLSIWEA